MQNFLSPIERENLKIQHKKERDKRVCDRIKAVLLFDKGWSFQQIADTLLLSDELYVTIFTIETICFIDGVHPTHNTKPAYGWIRRGECKEIPSNTGRQRLNLSGAIDIFTKKVLVQEDVTLNADATISFLQQLEAAYPEANKVHVFCDNARYYKNKDVTLFLWNSKIEMHFLPPYSPNLNPIERLWKFMNEKVLYNKYYERFHEFKKEVLVFLSSLADPPLELQQELSRRVSDIFRAIGKVNVTS
jgi:transposase